MNSNIYNIISNIKLIIMQTMTDDYEYIFWEIDRTPRINNYLNEIPTYMINSNYIILNSLFEHEGPTIPFTQKKIKLQIMPFNVCEEQEQCCSICMEENEKIKFIELNCHHQLCGLCMKQILDTCKNNEMPKCPYCREEIINIKVQTQNDYTILSDSLFIYI